MLLVPFELKPGNVNKVAKVWTFKYLVPRCVQCKTFSLSCLLMINNSPSFAVIGGDVTKFKYLGHVISNDMTDDADMTRQVRQLYAVGNVFSR